MTRSGLPRQGFFNGAMPRSIDALRQAEEGQHYALQLSVDEQGQIAIKLGWLLVAKAAAGRRDKINTLGRRTSCGLTETHPLRVMPWLLCWPAGAAAG
jgi:hypothetical protein